MAAQPKLDGPPVSSDGGAGIAFETLEWPALPACTVAPQLCAAWAEAVLAYWRHVRQAGALDPGQPLYVFDLAPGDGALASHVLDRLQAEPGLPPLRYVLCLAHAVDADLLLGHPSLRSHRQAGVLDALATGGGHGAQPGARLRLRSGRRLPVRAENPVVLLAWDYFGALPSELHGVHYGAAMTVRLAREARQGQSDAVHYTWSPSPGPAGAARGSSTPGEALLAHYAKRCNSNYLLLPLTASAALDHLAAWSGGRYLLLGADYGVSSERQLRLNGCCPPPEWPPQFPVALNVHAMALAQQWSGAATWCQQLDDGGRVLYLAWRDGGVAPDGAALDAVVAALARAHPDDSTALAWMAAGWDARQALAMAPAMLRLCGHDPALLRACLPALLAADTDCDGCALDAWHDALELTWRCYVPTLRYDDFYRQLAAMAAQIGHWGLARDCLRSGLACYGDDADDLYLLARYELATGRRDAAGQALALALTVAPDHAHCASLQAQLEASDPGPAWRQPSGTACELVLEPLQDSHAAALLRQYRDPQTAVMTSLPALETQQQARDWIAEQNGDANKLN